MAQHLKSTPIEGAVAEAVTVLMNTATVADRSADRIGYANGYKDKELKTRLEALCILFLHNIWNLNIYIICLGGFQNW